MDFDGYDGSDNEESDEMSFQQQMEQMAKMKSLFRIAGKVSFFIDLESETGEPTPTFAFYKDTTFSFTFK